MKKIKSLINEPSFMRSSLFIVFNAFLLYVLYFMIKNFNEVLSAGSSIIGQLIGALSPPFIGLLVAYLLNPLVTKVDERLLQKALIRDRQNDTQKLEKVCRLISIFITFIIVLAAIVIIIYSFAAMIFGQLVFTDIFATADNLIHYVLQYESELKAWAANNFPEGFLGEKISDFANAIINWISNNFSTSTIVGTVSDAIGSIINFVIGIIISIYLLNDKDMFIKMWNKLLFLLMPTKGAQVINGTLHEIDGVLSLFIRGALVDAVIVAILSSIGLSILGIEQAVLIGVFAGMANVIPYFGPVLGMIPAFIMGWLTGDFLHGVLAVVILLIVQQIDSNIIYPKVVGSSTGLHPLVVLLSVSVFGYFGGILGMLLAVPTAGVIAVFVRKWIAKKEASAEKTNQEEAKELQP